MTIFLHAALYGLLFYAGWTARDLFGRLAEAIRRVDAETTDGPPRPWPPSRKGERLTTPEILAGREAGEG